MKFIRFSFLYLVLLLLTGSCNSDYIPKPRGYFRIDFPAKEYARFDTNFPYTFEYPVYSRIIKDSSTLAEPYWINIVYNPFHAQLHISYKVINGNLKDYMEDSRTLVNKHIPKASSISQREYADPANKVYGLVYNIRGSDAASTFQFYLTDSTSNFLRGALYFNLVPNNDSLSPVIDYLKADIEHFISTFRWKNIRKK
jgi:gliding motility-associated lipoprotein GldD